jgi:hypothetical protein
MKWLKALVGKYQGELALACLLAVYAVAGFVVQGCGGGGGGGGGQPQPQVTRSRQVVRATSTAFGKLVAGTPLGSRGPKGFLRRLADLQRRSRQGTCPEVTTGWITVNGQPFFAITWDYGAGCTDEDGDFGKGQVVLLLSTDAFGNIGDTFAFAFNNFTLNGETISGTFAGKVTSASELEVAYNLQYQSQNCREHDIFEGTITVTEEDEVVVNGSGSFEASYLGSVTISYTLNDLLFTEQCDFPTGGSLRATYGSTTEVWSFPGTCGVGVVSVNGGQPQQVALKDIPSCD